MTNLEVLPYPSKLKEELQLVLAPLATGVDSNIENNLLLPLSVLNDSLSRPASKISATEGTIRRLQGFDLHAQGLGLFFFPHYSVRDLSPGTNAAAQHRQQKPWATILPPLKLLSHSGIEI